MPTTASQLRTKLILERRSKRPEVQDDWSEETPVWNEVARLWAKIENRSGDERLDAAQISSILTYKIISRYRSDVRATDRLRDPLTGTIYNIDTVDNELQQRQWLVFQATVKDGNS